MEEGALVRASLSPQHSRGFPINSTSKPFLSPLLFSSKQLALAQPELLLACCPRSHSHACQLQGQLQGHYDQARHSRGAPSAL